MRIRRKASQKASHQQSGDARAREEITPMINLQLDQSQNIVFWAYRENMTQTRRRYPTP